MYQYSSKQGDRSRRKQFLYLALISVIPFLVFAFIDFIDWTGITEIDYKIGSFFYDLRLPARTTANIAITRIGDLIGQVSITVAVVFILTLLKKWRTGIWFGLTVLFGSGFLNALAKNIFRRIRPDQIDHLIEQGGYAYPSGHSMGSMIMFGGLIFIFFRYFNSLRRNTSKLKWVVGLLFAGLILAIGLTRIYLGVHFPSDVLGGFSLGLAWLSLSIATFGYPLTKKDFNQQNKYRLKFR